MMSNGVSPIEREALHGDLLQRPNVIRQVVEKAQALRLYEGPPLEELPHVVSERLIVLLNRAVTLSGGGETNWRLVCETAGDPSISGVTSETLEYQSDDLDREKGLCLVEAYGFQDGKQSLRIEVLGRSSGAQHVGAAQSVFAVFNPLLETEFQYAFRETLAVMASYQIIAATRNIQREGV